MKHVAFATILDHLAGRFDARVADHLTGCEECSRFATRAQRLIDAGRRTAADAPATSRRLMKRARKIFRDHHATERPSLLALVLDSLRRPALAVRTTTDAPTRFVRYEGEITVEIQISATARGVELRGQVSPAGYAEQVVVSAGSRVLPAPVAPDGTFLLRNVPRGEARIDIGHTRISELTL